MEQKDDRLSNCTDLRKRAKYDPDFMSSISTGDNSWVYGYDPETKQMCSEWQTAQSPRPKKARQVKFNVKVMLIAFFDIDGLVHLRAVRSREVTEVRRQPVQKEKPSRPPSAAPSEEKEKEPAGPGYLFGFWKTRYENDDMTEKSTQKGLPAPGDMEYHNPHTYDPAPAPAPAEAASPAQGAAEVPKKNCVIQ